MKPAAFVVVLGLLCGCTKDAPGYFDYSGRDDALSGGAKMIPITTPNGTFHVWTKRIGNNPKVKVLLFSPTSRCSGKSRGSSTRWSRSARRWV